MNEISFIQQCSELTRVMRAIPLYFTSCYLFTIIYVIIYNTRFILF